MDESVLEKNGANENYFAQKKEEKCHKCEYSFSSKYDLREHLVIHRGEKTNICKQCGFATSRVGNFNRHVKAHSGEKSNHCNQCDFKSYWAANLVKHMNTHSGEKSNKCFLSARPVKGTHEDAQWRKALQVPIL